MKSITLDDEDLASAAAARQSLADARAALEQLYNRHADSLLRFLAARVKQSDLDDVHQAVWMRVWEKLPTGFQKGHFRGWLFQIARNHLIDLSRKRRPELFAALQEESAALRSEVELALIEREEAAALRRCLEKLDETPRRLVCGKLGGQDYATLCKQLQIDAARAHKLLFVAKAQLKTCVEKSLQ